MKSLILSKITILLAAVVLFVAFSSTTGKEPAGYRVTQPASTDVDLNTWVDANSILMFVTNKGSIAYDRTGYFGRSDGFYYPFSSIGDIMSGISDLTALYAGGLWVGGVDSVSGDTLVTTSHYNSDWGVGPISGDSCVPWAESDHAYRVYKLHSDSLAGNPNQDYLDWPTGDGAPVDGGGNPESLGDQTLWAVYNDLNLDEHITAQGSVGQGLGVEVHQTIWASPGSSADTTYNYFELRINHSGTSEAQVTASIVDTAALDHHTYWVIIDTAGGENVWNLVDLTTLDTVLANQPPGTAPVTRGFRVSVYCPIGEIESFEVVANASGPLVPSQPGAAPWAGFPVPGDSAPGVGQQVGDGKWLMHTADNGGTCGSGSRPDYGAFLSRATRDGANRTTIGRYDYEMRFTGSNDSPGVNGSYALEAYYDDNVFWVPFELWNIGIGTPDDPSDDFRLVPFIIDDGLDDVYELESWGCVLGVSGGDGEHSVDDGDDDPFTDWVYWYEPTDRSPGQHGYDTVMYQLVTVGNINAGYNLIGDEVFARTVLVNWNGGEAQPFNQDVPEQGTVFRITTGKDLVPPDTFSFLAEIPKIIVSSEDGSSVYLRYKMINKGSRTFENFFASIWFDPDLGDANDDYVGCDTLDDVFFCYNASAMDADYGSEPPAVGAKILEGPVVPSPGDVAHIDGVPLPDYKNLGMYSFTKLYNPYDPDSPAESYRLMNGLELDGSPKTNGTLYSCPGDPVTGMGDLDFSPDDRRMMASVGPFTFRPGDTQQVVIRLSAGRGNNRLASISELRTTLSQPYLYPTDVDDPPGPDGLPTDYALLQNYPNPFNPATTIEYSLPTRSQVSITIYNILGQEVKSLVNTTMPAGEHVARWDGTSQSGQRVASGVYFYRIKADNYVLSKKMLLLK